MGASAQVVASASSGSSSAQSDPMAAANAVALSKRSQPAATNAMTPARSPDPGPNWAAMALTTTGGVTSAYAKIISGNTNQHLARDNATIAESQAQDAVNAGASKAAQAETRGRTDQGRVAAAAAGQGVVAGAGSAGDAAAQTGRVSEVDALMIQRNAAREALGYQIKAGGDLIQGEEAKKNGDLGALATILNTGAQDWLESDTTYPGRRGSGVPV